MLCLAGLLWAMIFSGYLISPRVVVGNSSLLVYKIHYHDILVEVNPAACHIGQFSVCCKL